MLLYRCLVLVVALRHWDFTRLWSNTYEVCRDL